MKDGPPVCGGWVRG